MESIEKVLRDYVQKEESLKVIAKKYKKFHINKTSGFITNLWEEEENALVSWVREIGIKINL